MACSYSCAGPVQPVCEQNRCAIAGAMTTPPDGGDASEGTGGAGSAVGGGSPPRTAQLVVEPADGTTAQGTGDITLRLYDPVGVVDDAKLSEVGAEAFLETWPERAAVAFTVGVLPEPPTNYKVLRLVPQAPLEDRWYVAGLSSLPAAIAYWTPLLDGTNGNRFRTGSHPRVSQIQFCEKAPPGMKLIVQFSEPTMLTRPAAEIVTLLIADSQSPCESYGTLPDALYFTCAALTANAKVVVSVREGAQGFGGLAVEAASWNVDIATLPAGSCRSYTTAI